MDATAYNAPSLFLNHGGGPLPVLGDPGSLEIADSLRNVAKIVDLKHLKAIILVTAHREENVVTISSGERHELLFDYNNFPPESYKYKYEAPGDPVLAGRIFEAFESARLPAKLDNERGWDHGVFIPMMLINPEADIPIVQVSILKNHDAKEHYKIGEVLYKFREESVAIFGSGLSYHNMKEYRKVKNNNDGIVMNEEFDKFLTETCTGSPKKRLELLDWAKKPQALDSHPLGEADHLMPLIVNAGAGGSGPGRKVFGSVYLQKFMLSGFIWDK